MPTKKGPKPRIFTDPELEFVKEHYFKFNLMPREITPLLNKHFSKEFRLRQISTAVSERNWPAQRRLLQQKSDDVVDRLTRKEQNEIVKVRTKEGIAEVQDDISLRLVKVLDKATTMAETARSPRELTSSVAALNTAYNVFEKVNGLSGSGGGKGGNTFNFNFGARRNLSRRWSRSSRQ